MKGISAAAEGGGGGGGGELHSHNLSLFLSLVFLALFWKCPQAAKYLKTYLEKKP
jgi:hypothetical protein